MKIQIDAAGSHYYFKNGKEIYFTWQQGMKHRKKLKKRHEKSKQIL